MNTIEDLKKMREPFPPNQISKLPKPTKQQTEEVKADFKKGVRCQICGGWHHPAVIHLDYVGHAALTDRLLDTDPSWTWEPLAMSPDGLPVMDNMGGMWIKLTVCGVTRLGYGHAGDKEGGDAIKEIIGDALRNAGMRFGAALELWHKGDLHIEDNRISAPKEAAQASATVIDENRKSELEQMAIDAINFFKADQKAKCMELVQEVTDDKEKRFFWGLLSAESKLRTFILSQKGLAL
jgi:hypothetical protein